MSRFSIRPRGFGTLRRASAAIAVLAAGATLAVPAAASTYEGRPYLVSWERDGWGLGCRIQAQNGQWITVPSGTIMAVDVYAPDGTKIRTDRFKCTNGEWQAL